MGLIAGVLHDIFSSGGPSVVSEGQHRPRRFRVGRSFLCLDRARRIWASVAILAQGIQVYVPVVAS